VGGSVVLDLHISTVSFLPMMSLFWKVLNDVILLEGSDEVVLPEYSYDVVVFHCSGTYRKGVSGGGIMGGNLSGLWVIFPLELALSLPHVRHPRGTCE
jgi:hypothetical protein